ncbi:MAG: hypothetical protein WAV78_12500 [Xanthobacteraceae bacterium]
MSGMLAAPVGLTALDHSLGSFPENDGSSLYPPLFGALRSAGLQWVDTV